ncbi:MAG: hypothetical protein C0467_05555 [Planctomycetaceae bacterium]|nr:hypothetical protein [Planctomycetaceae bacterium]
MNYSSLTALPFLAFALFAASGGLRGQPPVQPNLAILKGHTDTVEGVIFSPDGNLIATGCFDRNVRLFEAAAGKEVRTYGGEQGHKGQVLSVAFNARGDQIATGGADNSARVWDIPVSFPVKTFATTNPATRIVVSASDGKTFAVAGADGTVKVFPAGEEKGAFELKGHVGAVTHLTLAAGTWVTAGADKTIRFWDSTGKQTAVRFAPAGIVGFAANANNSTVWLATADGRIQGLATPPPATIPPVVTALGSGLTFATYAAVLTKGGAVPATSAREWSVGGKVAGLAFSPDNTRVVTVGPGKECVSWQTGNGTKEKTFETGGDATAAAFTKDGQRLAVAGADGSVKLFGIGDGKLIGTFAAGGPVTELAFHPLVPQLVGTMKNAAAVWTVAFQQGQPLPPEFGRQIQNFPHPKGVASPCFNTDGQFYTAGEDNQVRRFRIASDVAVKNLQHPNLVDCIAFDDTGNVLATGCHDGVLRIWDVQKNTPLKAINAHIVTTPQQIQNPIYAVQWSPDFKQVFTSSYDKTIKLWDVASGNMVREFKAAPDPKPEEPKKDDKKDPPKVEAKKDDGPVGHRDQVFTIALTKDGKFLASGSSDKTVKLWDVASGKVVRDFANPDLKPVFPSEPSPSHPGWVHSVRFVPGDQFLVTAGAAPKGRSYLAVWNVATGQRVYGAERDHGPIHSIAVSPDGTKLVLGSAPTKGKTEGEALVIKLPGK